MNRRARLVLRVGLVSIPLAWLVALVIGSRVTTSGRSWWAWVPLRETPVRLLSCQLVDEGERAWYSSSAAGLTTVPVAVLVIALVLSVAFPRFARLVNRLAVAMLVAELGVFANSWLEKAIVGRVGLDQAPSCADVLQIGQAVSRGAYLDTTMLLGIALCLLAALEIDFAIGSSTRLLARGPGSSREMAVAWVVRVLLLGSAVYAFGRALHLASSPGIVLQVGGLMLITTVTALPVALASRPTLRHLGWMSWLVSLGLAFASWCATWAIGFGHERSEQAAPGVQTLRTFSDLPKDQLARLDGFQRFFAWWFLGLVVLGLLGAVIEGLRRRGATEALVELPDVAGKQSAALQADLPEDTAKSAGPGRTTRGFEPELRDGSRSPRVRVSRSPHGLGVVILVHDAYVIDIGRLWRRGRRRGKAQGVAVFGAPGFANDADGLASLLGSHQRLADWLTAAGLELEVSAAGLQTVDVMIDRWREDPTIASALSNDVGVFLGDVLLHEVSGARWHVWPNGHPVVRLAGGREIDVTGQTQTRVRKGQPHLGAVLDGAKASTRTRSR